MRSTLLVSLDGPLCVVRFTESQRALVREVLLFFRDRTDGDTISLVRTGSDRENLSRIWEKLSGDETGLSFEEVHILFSALAAAVILIPSEQEFFTRIGFFKEQAVLLANALVHGIESVVGSR